MTNKPAKRRNKPPYDQDMPKVWDDWMDGRTAKQIAEDYDISAVSIHNRLKAWAERTGVDYEDARKTRSYRAEPKDGEIYQAWVQGLPLDEIANPLDVRPWTILPRVRAYCFNMGIEYEEAAKQRAEGQAKRGPTPTPEDMPKVWELWKSGVSTRKIGVGYQCCVATLRIRLIEYASHIGEDYKAVERSRPRLRNKDNQATWDAWMEGKTIKELAEHRGVSATRVYSILADHARDHGIDYKEAKRTRKAKLKATSG